VRVAVIHGLARMAAIMATTYRPYLGVGLGPLSVCNKHTQCTDRTLFSATFKISCEVCYHQFYWISEIWFRIRTILPNYHPPKSITEELHTGST
jgi:hypothetical protein